MEFNQYSKVFFWNFKRRDNIEYNFRVIDSLVNFTIDLRKDEKNDVTFFYKPIFLIIAGIIECTIYDFLLRIKQHTKEEIPNLDKNDIRAIKDKNLPNEFQSYNDICKKHKLLGKDNAIYEEITKIIKMRNRVHIQNKKGDLPRDESELWTKENVVFCGELLKKIFQILCKEYPRHLPDTLNLNDFPEPWKKL